MFVGSPARMCSLKQLSGICVWGSGAPVDWKIIPTIENVGIETLLDSLGAAARNGKGFVLL